MLLEIRKCIREISSGEADGIIGEFDNGMMSGWAITVFIFIIFYGPWEVSHVWWMYVQHVTNHELHVKKKILAKIQRSRGLGADIPGLLELTIPCFAA